MTDRATIPQRHRLVGGASDHSVGVGDETDGVDRVRVTSQRPATALTTDTHVIGQLTSRGYFVVEAIWIKLLTNGLEKYLCHINWIYFEEMYLSLK